LVFVELDTSGLAGGGGTYAFLVGLGWFDGASFLVRQLLLSGYAAERVLLEEVADLAARSGTLVTYNGKTFDVPLIETRFLFHRMPPPFSDVPHLDMLHHARRLWRPRATSGPREERDGRTQTTCRLSAMEASVLGHLRENDVPAFEVPSRYFHYVRTGDARPLEAVFEHNRLDLLALAMLTATAATLLEEGPAASRTASEALGLGRVYERCDLTEEARACYARAAALGGSCAEQGEALWAYGVSCRRAGQFDAAAEAWQRILALRDCPAHITKDAAEALAVHHEHRLRDFRAARLFAVHSLELTVSATRREAARHRVARLDRGLGTRVVDPAPLFHSA
jgi:tetratricopeptide (TPR) repeat protein